MEQYYYTDGKERYGPFTMEQLKGRNVTQETLVWKEGMPDWTAAKNISDLQSLFLASESSEQLVPLPMTPPFREMPPKNWLIESIVVTICCCIPFGIVGIVNATKVETLWNSGQKDAALKASQEAGKWVKIGFITGIICIALYMILVFFGIMAGFGASMSQ
ncbi:MAG: CD225/dispanin family protein [Saprospiraceae bacterium]